jgi:exoribonuclease-2
VLRLSDIPLIIRLAGMPPAARGAQVKLDILRWDEVDLSVEARLLEIVTAPAAADAELDYEEEEDVGEDSPAEHEQALADAAAPADEQAEVADLASETAVTEPAPEQAS